jgi:predicted phosphodiesterase
MKFAIVSDVHAEEHNDWSRLVFERMGARQLDFVAFLGDVCTSPGDSWEHWFRPLQDMIRCPIFACRGNHDELFRWREWFKLPDDYVRLFPDVRCVFWDSNEWTHNGQKTLWLHDVTRGNEKFKFLFSHLTPRIGHWTYGLGPNRTNALVDVCRTSDITACFTGHMHGFDVLKWDKTLYFICGGGGGNEHWDFAVMHRSNYYLLIECDETLQVTLCQQHRDREQCRPMAEWINETRRPAF